MKEMQRLSKSTQWRHNLRWVEAIGKRPLHGKPYNGDNNAALHLVDYYAVDYDDSAIPYSGILPSGDSYILRVRPDDRNRFARIYKGEYHGSRLPAPKLEVRHGLNTYINMWGIHPDGAEYQCYNADGTRIQTYRELARAIDALMITPCDLWPLPARKPVVVRTIDPLMDRQIRKLIEQCGRLYYQERLTIGFSLYALYGDEGRELYHEVVKRGAERYNEVEVDEKWWSIKTTYDASRLPSDPYSSLLWLLRNDKL